MEHEFIFREIKTEVFHLRPDGLIKLAGNIIPQTSAVTNAQIADVLVDKEPGESGLVTIKAPNGKLEARYTRGQWHVRTDIPALLEEFKKIAPPQQSVLPGAPTGPTRDVQFPMPDPVPTARPPTLYGVIVLVAILLVVAVAGYFTFEEPINRVADAHAARKETRAKESEIRLIEAKAKEDYRVLEKTVRAAHRTATEVIAEVEKKAQGLDAQFSATATVSLANLADQPESTPREIDQLLRRDPAFLQSWNRLLNAYVSARKLAEYRQRLQAIDAHDKAAALQEEDRMEAERMGSAMRRAFDALAEVQDDLAIVQEKLASRRLQEKMSQETRSSP